MTRLLIVRHGETDWNAEGRVQGHRDIPMNEEGRRQMLLAADALAEEAVDAVYSSDLARAEESARILAAPHRLPVNRTEDLRERDWGIWQGNALTEIAGKYPELYRRMRAGEWVSPEGAEPYERLQRRVVRAMQRIADAHQGRTSIVATHGGPLKAFVCWLLGAPLAAQTAMRTGNAAITNVFVHDGRFVLESYNVTTHLHRGLGGPGAPVNPGKAVIEGSF